MPELNKRVTTTPPRAAASEQRWAAVERLLAEALPISWPRCARRRSGRLAHGKAGAR